MPERIVNKCRWELRHRFHRYTRFGKLNEMAESFPTRSLLKRIQTPQAFELSMLKKAYQLAIKEGKTNFTDDASILNHYQLADVLLVQGDEWNIKITTAIDLLLAEQILLKRNK